MKTIDLPDKTINELHTIFASYPEIEKAIIFGSRALGNAKPGSDIDCALSGKHLTMKIVAKIQQHLEEETLIPYFFDCVHLETISNPDLIDHIKQHGLLLYKASEQE